MLESPSSANMWISDPDASPVLSQIFKTYHAEKHALQTNRYEEQQQVWSTRRSWGWHLLGKLWDCVTVFKNVKDRGHIFVSCAASELETYTVFNIAVACCITAFQKQNFNSCNCSHYTSTRYMPICMKFLPYLHVNSLFYKRDMFLESHLLNKN